MSLIFQVMTVHYSKTRECVWTLCILLEETEKQNQLTGVTTAPQRLTNAMWLSMWVTEEIEGNSITSVTGTYLSNYTALPKTCKSSGPKSMLFVCKL